MLHLVEGRTAATWVYVDEPQADLAICEPDSALAQATIKQAVRRGRPHCVVLLRPGAQPLPHTHSVHAPLRVSDFISMLDDTLANAHAGADAANTVLAASTASVASSRSGDSLLLGVLRNMMTSGDSRAHCVTIGGVRLFLMPSQGSVLADEQLTPSLIARFSDHGDIDARCLPESDVIAPDSSLHRCSLQFLLWHCAISTADGEFTSWLPRGAGFGLKRWPDFGRLTHEPWHLRLTALLVREAFTPQQMTVLIDQPLRQVQAFLHACDLCGLLRSELRPGDIEEPPQQAAASQGRWSTIFSSIRDVLSMGKR